MQLFTQPLYVATVLLLVVVLAEWLSKKKYFRYLGSALIVIMAAAVLANTGFLPSSQNAPSLYGGIFEYVAPLAIFFLLLDVKLKDLKYAGLPMLLMFLLGSLATVCGALLGYYVFSPQDHGVDQAYAVAGMYTGTYIGGSVNLNAVALHYGVIKNGTQFAAINAVDNIVGTIWIMATLILPSILQKWLPAKKKAAEITTKAPDVLSTAKEEISVSGVSILLALGLGTIFISQVVSFYIPQVPTVLTLTTVALFLAQIPFVQEIKGSTTIGFFLVLVFLAVVGAYCDVNALVQNGWIAIRLLVWVALLILIHGVLIFGIGSLFTRDWALISVASNANVAGTATAGVLATSLGRPDLRLPGILAGSVGNAIGTYIGILVAEYLK